MTLSCSRLADNLASQITQLAIDILHELLAIGSLLGASHQHETTFISTFSTMCFIMLWIISSILSMYRTCLCVATGTSTPGSGILCWTRPCNDWASYSRDAARSACVLPEFTRLDFRYLNVLLHDLRLWDLNRLFQSAPFTRCGSALLGSYLLDHPFLSLLTLRKYSSVLLRSCVSITPCVSLSWRSTNCLVANCSLVCTACTLMCCAWFAGLTSLCARRCPALVISLSVDTSVLRVCSASASGLDSHRSFSSRARHSCSSDAAATAALAMCLMVSGHFSTQTCSF